MELPIYLTLEEAEKILPDIKIKMGKVIRLTKSIDVLESIDVDSDNEIPEVDIAMMDINKNYFKKMYFFYKELLELSRLGAVVKDADEGLVDFYSKFENRDIFLCWKFGENKISHWHEVNTGFSERKSISLLKKVSKTSQNIN